MSTTTTLTRRRNAVALVAGVLCLLIGGVVMAGYASQQPWLVTLFPGSATMRLASAVGIFCCGAAVLFLAGGYRKTCAAAAVAAVLVAVADLVAAFAGFNPSAGSTQFAGTLSTCLLVVGGGSLVLMSGVVHVPSRLAVVGSAGSVLNSVGIVAVVSYVAGVNSAFTEGDFSQLGIHTAIAIAALGAALIRFAWRDTLTLETGTPGWLPFLIAAGTLATTFCLYGAVAADQEADFEHQITFEAEELRQFLSAGLENRVQPLIRLARQRAVTPEMKRDEWDAAAQMIMTRGGYQAIEWVDAAGRVLWATPPGAGDSTPDGNASFEARRRAAFEAARRYRGVAATRPIDLVTGGKGTIVLVPVFIRDELAGFVAGVFRYHLLFQTLLASNPTPQYAITVQDGSELLFSQGLAGSSSRLKRTSELGILQTKWTVSIAPTEALVLQSKSPAAGALLVIGVFLAIAFALLVRVAQRPAARAIFESPAGAPTAGVAAYGDGTRLPVVSYGPKGGALAWNEAAGRLLGSEPPSIPPSESGFRTLTATFLRANGSPEHLEALRALLESCTTPTLVFDAEGRYMAANSAAARLLGWSDANWAGKTLGAPLPAGSAALEIQSVLVMQGQWTLPAAARAAAAAV